MKEEHIFNLQTPVDEAGDIEALLKEAEQVHRELRWRRLPDRAGGFARFFLRFPLTAARPDLAFQKWFEERCRDEWEFNGPVYGRWGFS